MWYQKYIKAIFKRPILKRNESGRSMVEMLAVLAVVGVLSIGGFAGYNFAITKYRTNVLIDEINQRFVIAKQQATLGLPIDMSEFQEKIFGDVKIDISYADDDSKDALEIMLKNVPIPVAEQLLAENSALWQLPLLEFYVEGQDSILSQSTHSHPVLVKNANATCSIGLVGAGIVALMLIAAVHDAKEGKRCIGGGKNPNYWLPWLQNAKRSR